MTELADLLAGATARHALAHRDITTVFRILRDAGVSQTRLAQATGQQQSEIISGRQVQSVALLERIADGLGVRRGWMGLAYDTDLEPEPAAGDKPTADESTANLLRHAATVLWGRPVFGPADPISVKDTPTPVPRRIGVELDAGLPNEGLKYFQLGVATAPSPLLRAKLEYDCAWALGLAAEAVAALRRARETYQAANDEPRLWKYFATTLPHVEGCTYLALGRFDSAAVALSAAVDGASHAVGCAMYNYGHLAAAQLRCGELRSGIYTAERAIGLARRLRSVSVRDGLAPLHQAAAARRDSACQDLARELATLRSAA